MIPADIRLEILRRRPFKSWEDFKQAFGFDEDAARLVRRAGATLGDAKSKRSRRRTPPKPPAHVIMGEDPVLEPPVAALA